MAFLFVAGGAASAETRTLKLYFLHTKERAEITYKRNGRYISSGLDQVSRFLRDWRRNEPTKMDPRLLDLLWEVYHAVGARDYINVISAYRSPATNSMLRKRSNGVAKNSQHTLGKAIDFYIPGVSLSTLRKTALKMQGGGVGYYPTSGSPFVHIDVGSVRHWPRMKRSELLALFPNGKTAHIPSDGKPLAGYEQALAAIKSGKRNSAPIRVASAGDSKPKRGLLSMLFGGADEEEDIAESAQPARQVAAAPEAAASAPATPEPESTPETILASLTPSAIPFPQAAPRAPEDVGQVLALTQTDEPRDTAQEAQEALDAAAAVLVDADEEKPVEVALNIPLPTQRPDYPPADAEVQVADAAPAGLPLPGNEAEEPLDPAAPETTGTPSATVAAYLPRPGQRPDADNSQGYVLASLPTSGPSYGAPPISGESGEVVVSSPTRRESTDGRLARLGAAPAASQRLALISSDGQGPEAAIATGVKTTAKSAKPRPGDSRPDTRAVLVPIPRQIARWALNPAAANMDKNRTRAPSFEIAHVRSAPQMVYTAGFESGTSQPQSNRFTGKAVTFLSVARFSN